MVLDSCLQVLLLHKRSCSQRLYNVVCERTTKSSGFVYGYYRLLHYSTLYNLPGRHLHLEGLCKPACSFRSWTCWSERERMLGVITKPDLSPDSDSEQVFLTLARNEDIFFELGWHITRNCKHDENFLLVFGRKRGTLGVSTTAWERNDHLNCNPY